MDTTYSCSSPKNVEIALRGDLVPGAGDLFFGRKLDIQGFKGYMDDVKLYNYAMGSGLIASLSHPNLTGIVAPFRIQLASTHCSIQEASSRGLCATGWGVNHYLRPKQCHVSWHSEQDAIPAPLLQVRFAQNNELVPVKTRFVVTLQGNPIVT
uniref:Uncharacterized protein n=1 Tax=Babesia bovis TaxID=5865 RepID=A7AQN5_BABBO|eukprot:XP_001610422.1 hypothetical protein [Babesia bovis T2Bo]